MIREVSHTEAAAFLSRPDVPDNTPPWVCEAMAFTSYLMGNGGLVMMTPTKEGLRADYAFRLSIPGIRKVRIAQAALAWAKGQTVVGYTAVSNAQALRFARLVGMREVRSHAGHVLTEYP